MAAPPRAIASPCWAAARRAPISSASPIRSRAEAISAASCSANSCPSDELAWIDRQFGQRRSIGAPALDRLGDRLAGDPGPAVGVQEVALGALVEEPLLIVLAVDLDQPPADSG